MTTLKLRNVTRRFGTTLAVDNMSLDVADGEFICLLGPSGCGKSTALRMIAGFDTPDDGDILIDDTTTLDVPPNRRATSMVFQSHALWTHMTVFGNIAFGLQLRRLSRQVIFEKVTTALRLVGLTGLEKRRPGQLSGGQQQRVALARSLVLEPKILLLDEPFSSLDAHLRIRLRDELKAIQRRLGLTTVFVTHDQEEAMTLADRIVVMNHGAVEQVAVPGSIYNLPATLFGAGFIGSMTVLSARPGIGYVVAGPLRLPLATARSLTGEWMLALRPEDCELTSLAPKAPYPCVVESIVDLGATRIATVALTETRIKVHLDRRQTLQPGDRVGLAINRALIYRDGALLEEIIPSQPVVSAEAQSTREEMSA